MTTEGSSDSTPRGDSDDDNDQAESLNDEDNDEEGSISNPAGRQIQSASIPDFYKNQVLHSEEVQEEMHTENTPNRNMRAVGHIGVSSISSYNQIHINRTDISSNQTAQRSRSLAKNMRKFVNSRDSIRISNNHSSFMGSQHTPMRTSFRGKEVESIINTT